MTYAYRCMPQCVWYVYIVQVPLEREFVSEEQRLDRSMCDMHVTCLDRSMCDMHVTCIRVMHNAIYTFMWQNIGQQSCRGGCHSYFDL